jgi:hypothetical protein
VSKKQIERVRRLAMIEENAGVSLAVTARMRVDLERLKDAKLVLPAHLRRIATLIETARADLVEISTIINGIKD